MKTCLCLCCGEVYDLSIGKLPKHFDSDNYACPKIGCGGNVVEIDEFMLPTIQKLKEFGFNTKSCCSGHILPSKLTNGIHIQTYIILKRYINGIYILKEPLEKIKNSLPKEFKLEILEEDCILIEKINNCETILNAMSVVYLNCSELLKWVEETLQLLLTEYDFSWCEGELESEDFDNLVEKE